MPEYLWLLAVNNIFLGNEKGIVQNAMSHGFNECASSNDDGDDGDDVRTVKVSSSLPGLHCYLLTCNLSRLIVPVFYTLQFYCFATTLPSSFI